MKVKCFSVRLHLYNLITHYVYECDLELNVSKKYFNFNFVIDQELKIEYDRLKEDYLDDEKLQAWFSRFI